MSSGEFAVSFLLKVNDQASGPAARALQVLSRALKETEGVAKSTSDAAIAAFRKLASAREILGIRSEKAIQNEIAQTEAAYKRLADSGQASARELARAQDAMRQKVAGLRQELEGVKQSAGGAGSALRAAMALTGAGAAAKMVLQGPLQRSQSYDRQLVHAANTAFAGQSLEERKAGMGTIHAAVKSAVQQGGTAEAALAAYQKLAGSNEYSAAQVAAVLPKVVRAATANGGANEQFADIALAAKRNLGLDDFDRVANMATTAGQLGGFEIRDMAKGLPAQLAAAKNAGLSGYSGYASLLALNQAAVSTAGTTDQASNNVVNLLNKINSRDTAHDFQKLGIDLDGSLLKAQEKGTNTLEAFGNLVDRVVAKDSRYQALQTAAKSATGDKQKEIYANMAQIVEGAGIGKVLQDREALMGFLAYRNQHDKYGQFGTNTQAIYNTGDSVGANMALVSETASFKVERMEANKALAMQDALDKVNPLLGGMADGITGIITEFPVLSAAVSGATLGVSALGAAAMTAAGALTLLGGGKGAGSVAVETAKKVMSGGGGALAALGAAAAPLGAIWGVSEWAGDTSHDESRVAGIKGGTSGLKKLMASLGFDKDADIDAIREKNREGLDTSNQVQKVEVTVRVENGNIVAAVNEANARMAQRH